MLAPRARSAALARRLYHDSPFDAPRSAVENPPPDGPGPPAREEPVAKPFFDLERLDPDGLRRVAGILRGVGFTEEGVRKRLALKDIGEIELGSYPHYLNYRLRRRSPLDVAIMLLLLQGVVTEEELADLFDKPARQLLKTAGVVMGDRASRTWRSRVSLYPLGDRLFFTDHRFAHHAWIKARVPRDPVMYLGPDTYYLARTTLHRPIRGALDLCAGSGVHGVLAAGTAERSVGVDISPRAVNFARVNAMLNDAWNAVFVEGDLFGPVAGERFDLIVANPPFVPSPVYELTYRDGGPSGADVLRRIVASLPDYLTSDGIAQIVTHVAEREGESYLDRIRRWLGSANINMHALRVGEEDVVGYAVSQTKKTFGEGYQRYAGKLVEWITNLRSQRFHRVVAVVLTFQWNEEAPHPPWTQEDETKPPLRDMSDELARLLTAKRRVRKLSSLRSLDGMRVGVPDDLLLVERRRPTGTGFETKDFRVTFRDGHMSPELDVKPLVRDLLERVDNRSTVPQVIARLAEDTEQEASDIDEQCRRAFLVMFERGLVTLDDVGGGAPASSAGRAPEPDLVRPAQQAAVQPAGGGSAVDELPRPQDDPFLYSEEPDDPPRTLHDDDDDDGGGAATGDLSTDSPRDSVDPDAPPPEAGPGHTLRT